MVDVGATGNKIEERSDLGEGEDAEWQYWNDQEKIAERQERNWRYRSRAIVRRYRDDRGDGSGVNTVASNINRFNILWSNVQTLLPTLYGRTPKPDVQRRFKDQDDTGRLASILLERCLSYSMEQCDFDAVMTAVVEDRLLPGRGVARVLYVPHFGDKIEDDDNDQFEAADEQGSEIDNPGDQGPDDSESDKEVAALGGEQDQQDSAAEDQATPQEELREVVFEEANLVYVFWEDYLEGPARQWKEVPWVRYRSYLTRDELIERFGDDIGRQIKLDYSPNTQQDSQKDKPPQDIFKKAVVHETWDKEKKEVIWWCPGTPDLICDKVDDPLQLKDFFPSGDPLLATTTNDKRIPVPDYLEYQDQARELDTLTARIDRLTRALKVSGVYAGSEKQVLQQLIDEGTENRLIPVEDWQHFAMDKGGLKGVIEWVPIEQIAATLIQLYDARDRIKQIIYEVTGIADVMRGATSPQETFGAQDLKARFGTLRTSPQQKEVAKFAGNCIRLMGELICLNFSDKTISLMTGYPQLLPVPPIPPMPQQPLLPAPSNVVPMRPGMPAPQAQPTQPGQPPKAPQPNPQAAQAMQAYQQQMQQWNQTKQAAQAVVQKNQQLTAAFQAAVALLRKDALEGFRIDVEADSTATPNEEQERAERTQFLSEFVPFMEQMVPMAQGNPAMAGVAKEFALFAMRGFKVARTLEEAVEKAFETLAQMPPTPQKGQIEAQKAQAQIKDTQVRAQSDIHDTDAKAATDRLDIAARQQSDAQKLALQQAETNEKLGLERQRLALEAAQAVDEQRYRASRGEAAEARSVASLT